jgi:hypothetical protein
VVISLQKEGGSRSLSQATALTEIAFFFAVMITAKHRKFSCFSSRLVKRLTRNTAVFVATVTKGQSQR